MESFGEANLGPDSNPVGDAAADELERLAELADSAWYSQNLCAAPNSVKVTFVAVSAGVLTLMAVLLSQAEESWVALGFGSFLVVGFVAGTIRLERRYAPARTATTFPPRRVWKKQWKLLVLLQVPVLVFVQFFIRGIEADASWQYFVGIVVAFLFGANLWSLAIVKLGIVQRIAPKAIVET